MADIIKETRDHMEKCLTALQNNFAKVRTGRANPHILDHIQVDYYGVPTPINQLAGIRVPEATMLLVEPWDKSSLGAIERAIRTSDLGINPSNDGTSIRLPFPAPTEERRRELAKECRHLGEEARVAIRNVRRDANAKIERNDELSEDEQRRQENDIQAMTDEFVKKVGEAVKAKEAEVMAI